ncbi:long-chain fatty acid--CoA ligase [Riemerella anatipestifer]|nr:long-chain fatty acid--CoA ligase [Riemerella anatipestifer]
MNLAAFVSVNAEKYLSKPAIGFKKYDEWKSLSWTMFKRTIFKTANALKDIGVKESDKVAIYSDNSAEWIIFDLAVLSLGAISVPIYSTNGKQQTQYCIQDSGASIVFVGNQEQYDICSEIMEETSSLKFIIAAKKTTVLRHSNSIHLENLTQKGSEDFEVCPRDKSDLSTILYTSGTSGTPKGVMLTHGNLIDCFQAHTDFFKFKNFENETSLAFLPLSHIFERSWTLFCLSKGAKVSFLENTKLIAHALEEVKPSMMCAVPRFYQKIYGALREMVEKSSSTKKKIFDWALNIGTQCSEYRRKGKSVPFGLALKDKIASKLIFNKIKQKLGGNLWFMPCGGAAISPEILKFFDAMGIHITVGYGLTETTATLTCFPAYNYEYETAGIPIGDTQIKIGEHNEILVKGSGVMKGYYNLPEETAKAFTEDGWFRTGDAGVIENGTLKITDRIKDLMKTSNGKYITPQVIENILTNSNYIQQAMVVAEGKPFVTAVIVPNFEALKEKVKAMKLSMTDWNEIVSSEKITQFYHDILQDVQKELSAFERVKKFVLLPSEFEIKTGEITPTLKVKRNVVMSKYNNLIERLYS